MNPIWIIAKRELSSYFDSLVAYILLVAFLGVTGFFTWLFAFDIFFRQQASLLGFFDVAQWSLFIFIPAITMRQLAEEKKTGTIELLLTKAVTDWQVILGKFLSAFLMVCIALAFTIPYYITVSYLGNIDHGATILGYVGLMLFSAAYIAIGLFASSITNNQIVAFLIALIIGIFLQLIFGMLAFATTGWLSEFFDSLNMLKHFDSLKRGVLDVRDIVFFGSIIFLGLFFSERMISSRS